MIALLFMFMLPVFLAFTGLSHGVIPSDLAGKLEGTVTFNTTIEPQVFTALLWTFANETTGTSTTIINGNAATEGYRDRISLDSSTATLELRHLTFGDIGVYTLFAVPKGDTTPLQGSTKLLIFEPASNAVVTPNTADYVEFNDTAVLTCSVSTGSSLSYVWYNGSSEVTAGDGVQLGDGNTTLTIISVTRYDQGPFRCYVFNPISSDTSEAVELNINFGPEKTTMMVSPSNDYYEEGSTLNLTCLAVSNPPALFYWFQNGAMLSHTGPELAMNIMTDQSGNYNCQAFNTKTLRYHMSEASVVTVLKKISAAVIKPDPEQPKNGTRFTLTCEADGTISTVEWMKDDKPHTNKTKLVFDAVNENDNGIYLCNVSNPFSSADATYNLTVIPPPPGGSSHLSPGVIAAIVIVVLLVIVAFGGGGYYLYKKGTFRSNGSTSGTGDKGQVRGASEQQEVNYAEISQFQKRGGGSVPLGNLGTSPTEYAQIQGNRRAGGGSRTASPPNYDDHVKRTAPQPGQVAGRLQPIPRATSQAARAGQPVDDHSTIYSQIQK